MEIELQEPVCNKQDIMSQLPDDILASIISKLPLSEAMATSLLSSRWRHLSTHMTHLSFCSFDPKSQTSVETIDKWFDFVLAKEVEVLNISLDHRCYFRDVTFHDLIRRKVDHPSPALNFLKELSLHRLYVDDLGFELLLTKLPLVESLSIENCNKLRNVKIVDYLCNLKRLDLSWLGYLESLEIGNAMNLVWLKCHALYKAVVKLYNLPKLIELDIGDQGSCHRNSLMIRILSAATSCIHHQILVLRVFTQSISIPFSPEGRELPNLSNIKHLELTISMSHLKRDTYVYLPLVGAWPSLEKLEIKFLWRCAPDHLGRNEPYINGFWLVSENHFKSKAIKKLKVSGYLGCGEERQFLSSLIENYGVEELVVEVCDLTPKMRKRAKARASHDFTTSSSSSLKTITII